jgi:DNA uptake protein ComE-like DNA-binding protein
MRAGLVFVLVSLVAGTSLREWRRAHETRLRDLVARLSAAEEGAPDPGGAAALAATDSVGARDGTRGGTGSPHGAAPVRADRTAALRPASIDPDRATAAEWERLPGIGPALAGRIVGDRAANGPFGGPEGLLRVRGIGPRTLDRIRPYLRPAAPADTVTAN